MTMPALGQGGDPIAALRATDNAAGEEQIGAVAAALDQAKQPEPDMRNRKFNVHTQAVAGLLMAKEEEFKRAEAELTERRDAAEEAHNAAMVAASDAFAAAQMAAQVAINAAMQQINDEADDLARARDGIRTTVAALT